MAENAIVDASFLIASLNRQDTNHAWAATTATRYPPPWQTCEPALSEVFYLTERSRHRTFAELIRRRAINVSFRLNEQSNEVLALMEKYSDVPMSLADACLVRMTEILPDAVLLTTDTDFRIYRRLGRKTIPCIMPV
jgi:predicted nucleic acid-binding protein